MHSFIVIVLWAIFAWMLRRAIVNHRFMNRRPAYIWIQVFLALVTVSLMGKTIETEIDTIFADWPVTLYIKSMAMLSMFHLYYLTIRDIDAGSYHYWYLSYLGPSALLGGTLYYLVFSQHYPRPDFRYLTLALRDAIMVIYLVSAFLPSSFRLWRLEQVSSMRVKHLASMVCCLCYIGIGGVNITVAVLNGLRLPQAESLSTAFVPVVYLGAVSFLVILVPHRWLMPLQYPVRLYRWERLKRLEVRLQVCGAAQPWRPDRSLRDLQPNQLDLTIYRSLIFILDHYPLIRTHPDGEVLYHQIQAVVQSSRSYADLIKTLSEIV